MQAVLVRRTGGPEVLEVAEVAAGEPGPGQLLVSLAAAGVNFIDVYHREGRYPLPLPFTPGLEGAGTVTALGPEVSGFAPGDRVAWASALGSYAEQVLVSAAAAVPVPAEVDLHTAAAVALQGMTAHYLACATYPVQPGDTVLVHAAAGGVGLLLTQIVGIRGGRVIATCSAEKAALARAAGAQEVLDYAEVPARVRQLTGGEGVAAVYDGVGQATFDASLASLRPRGVLALFGASSGPVPPVDLQRLNAAGSVYVTRPTLAHYTATRAELLARAGEVLGWVAQGRLRVHVGARYPLDQARRAHEDLQARRTTGKLLLLP